VERGASKRREARRQINLAEALFPIGGGGGPISSVQRGGALESGERRRGGGGSTARWRNRAAPAKSSGAGEIARRGHGWGERVRRRG
jgi:hypothetical protein